MKRISLLMQLLLLLFITGSCEEDNLEPVGNWELSSAIPATPAESATVTLDEKAPNARIRFEWEPAISSNNYGITYNFVLDSAANADFSSPILSMAAGNGGKNAFVTPTAAQIDQALMAAGYDANTAVPLKWTVIAHSLSKEATSPAKNVSIVRFKTDVLPEQLYLSGTATEKGTDLNQAIAMRPLKDVNGNFTHVFEAYTSLTDGGTFKIYSQQNAFSLKYGMASANKLSKNGAGISSPGAGQYRITVDLNTNTYSFLKITKWSLVGDAISGGWGGDEPLEYKGNGVWQKSVAMEKASGFIFRANGDWAYQLKKLKGTTNQLMIQSQAEAAGLSVEDLQAPGTGKYIVSINFAADQYTYSLEKDNTVTTPTEMPAKLYLISGGTQVVEFVKDGESFKSNIFVALQKGTEYTLNSASDGSGTAYSFTSTIGQTSNPDNDNVSGSADFGTGNSTIAVAKDQAYQLTVNFSTGKLTWKYYNIKLFHWNNSGGWDARKEYVMTYKHPYTYEVTADLSANFSSKFNSPWEVEFGTAETALTGTMISKSNNDNYNGIKESGSYKATIKVNPDYKSTEYSFVKQ